MRVADPATAPAVAIVTLGCGRNDVDTDQVGGALSAAGYRVVDEPDEADCVLVNTCTFIEPARAESVDTVLAATELGAPVLVMGCMAERYGSELGDALPEVAGVVGFKGYARLPELVAEAVGLASPPRPVTSGAVAGPGGDPETMLPLVAPAPGAPPTAAFPVRTVPRGPWAYLKLAGGCDRACTFCTIPSYRGSFASRPVEEVVAEARWLAEHGAAELVCVSENTTSYGKDLPAGRAAQLELLDALATIDGLERVRLMYLQPDEVGVDLLEVMAANPVVAPYYDLSLQHASPRIVRAMARGGGEQSYLELIDDIRARDPQAVFRSSFIVGFPGETDEDVAVLERFLTSAALDWVGFFPFSLEDGTASASLPDQVPHDEARARRDHLVSVAESVAEDRAESFVGRTLEVLVETSAEGQVVGRSYREAPETDGEVTVRGCQVPAGRWVAARITATDGIDLLGEPAAPR